VNIFPLFDISHFEGSELDFRLIWCHATWTGGYVSTFR